MVVAPAALLISLSGLVRLPAALEMRSGCAGDALEKRADT